MAQNTPQVIVVHHSVTPRDLAIVATEGSINRTHQNRGFPKSSLGWFVGYHYMIFGDGTVKQYRADSDVGAHCSQQSMNFHSIGICVIGNFDNPSSTPKLKSETPSSAQVVSLKRLVSDLMVKYRIGGDLIYPHRYFAPKSCYGNVLPDNWVQSIIGNSSTEVTMNRELAVRLLKSLYGFGATGLLRRTEDPEKVDPGFKGRVDRLLAAKDWVTDLSAQADEIAKSKEFIEVRIKVN